MKGFAFIFAFVVAALSLTFGWSFFAPQKRIVVSDPTVAAIEESISPEPVKTKEERVAEAMEKSSQIKGLYMTADVANDQGAGATRIRNEIIRLADTTEINGLVIDVKEVCGPDYDEKNLKKLLEELREKNIWAIARIAVSKDASQIYAHPDWYLKRSSPKNTGDECAHKKYLRAKSSNQLLVTSNQFFWQDKRGGYWMDPASPEVREYLLQISKKMIDLGFAELQFDYIRFPSDGDIQNIVYPFWGGKTSKCKVMLSLFEFLSQNLREYKPEIVLSADLFGYAAIGIDTGIGQCLDIVGDNFDFVSFMVYPSHYYSGFLLRGVPQLERASVRFNRAEVRANPDVVVGRSTQFARDFFDGLITVDGEFWLGTSTATTTVPTPQSKIKQRPWLEDFFHEEDRAAGRPYGVKKVRLQIDAAEKVESHGWLLWNAANLYTEGALNSP